MQVSHPMHLSRLATHYLYCINYTAIVKSQVQTLHFYGMSDRKPVYAHNRTEVWHTFGTSTWDVLMLISLSQCALQVRVYMCMPLLRINLG